MLMNKPTLKPCTRLRPSTTDTGRVFRSVRSTWTALILLMLGGSMAECDSGASKAPTAPSASVSASAETKPEPAAEPDFAPPPPPEPEEEPEKKPTAVAKGGAAKPAGGSGPCSACGKGVASAALSSAVSRSASLARGCYQRALRGGDAQGALTVSVRIGSHGGVCGASIVGDTLRNPGISQCVLSKFRGQTFPKPEKGCVIVNIPFAFKMK